MLAAAARLRRRDDFTAAVRGGRRSRRGALVLHLSVPGTDDTEPTRAGGLEPPPRVGFVVPRTVGGAVVRNLVRRRLRHLLRDRLDRLPPGAALVVRVLPEAAERDHAGLAADLDAALAAALRPARRPR